MTIARPGSHGVSCIAPGQCRRGSAMNWWVARTRRGNVAPTVHAPTRWGNYMRRPIIAAALTAAAIAVLTWGATGPAAAAASPGPATVATGYSHTCAVRTGGTL